MIWIILAFCVSVFIVLPLILMAFGITAIFLNFTWPVLRILLIIVGGILVLGGPVLWIGGAIWKFKDEEIVEGIWWLLGGWIPGAIISVLGLLLIMLLTGAFA